MEFLKELLTGTHIFWPYALLQMVLYVLILFTTAVLFWWFSIVVNDLIKRLKTGAKK
jgi:hypothetical protein